jgi:putative ABC transport system permease protein
MGASARQVGWSVIGEATGVGVVASIIGVGFGILVALGMNALLSATGFGASGTSLVISPRSILVAIFVGLVVTVASAISPAVKATRVPPIAAMRDDFTLVGLSARMRAIIGAVLVAVGATLIGFALIATPDAAVLLVSMIVGALAVFLGVALLSPLVAGPIVRAIGVPLKAFKVAGNLATDNASRNPQRTASTASALMIGLALISMATVVGTSLKDSFSDTINGGVISDWVITSGPSGFTPEVAAQLETLPELQSVSPARIAQGQVDGSNKSFISFDYGDLEQLFRIDLREGSLNASTRGVLVQSGPARDRGLAVGDTMEISFVDTGPQQVPVAGIYDDGSVLGNWILDNQTVAENTSTQVDQFVAMLSAPGVSNADARAAIEPIIAPYPDVKLQTREEYTADQIAQVDQLLAVVNVFLLLAVIIAFIGITNTLALSVFERTRELGLLRAVGMSRRQVRRMVRLEAVIVSVFGALLGVVVGVIFGVVIAVSLPDDIMTKVSVPVPSLVQFVVLAGLVGIVAAVVPAFRAGRLKVLDAIASE